MIISFIIFISILIINNKLITPEVERRIQNIATVETILWAIFAWIIIW